MARQPTRPPSLGEPGAYHTEALPIGGSATHTVGSAARSSGVPVGARPQNLGTEISAGLKQSAGSTSYPLGRVFRPTANIGSNPSSPSGSGGRAQQPLAEEPNPAASDNPFESALREAHAAFEKVLLNAHHAAVGTLEDELKHMRNENTRLRTQLREMALVDSSPVAKLQVEAGISPTYLGAASAGNEVAAKAVKETSGWVPSEPSVYMQLKSSAGGASGVGFTAPVAASSQALPVFDDSENPTGPSASIGMTAMRAPVRTVLVTQVQETQVQLSPGLNPGASPGNAMRNAVVAEDAVDAFWKAGTERRPQPVLESVSTALLSASDDSPQLRNGTLSPGARPEEPQEPTQRPATLEEHSKEIQETPENILNIDAVAARDGPRVSTKQEAHHAFRESMSSGGSCGSTMPAATSTSPVVGPAVGFQLQQSMQVRSFSESIRDEAPALAAGIPAVAEQQQPVEQHFESTEGVPPALAANVVIADTPVVIGGSVELPVGPSSQPLSRQLSPQPTQPVQQFAQQPVQQPAQQLQEIAAPRDVDRELNALLAQNGWTHLEVQRHAQGAWSISGATLTLNFSDDGVLLASGDDGVTWEVFADHIRRRRLQKVVRTAPFATGTLEYSPERPAAAQAPAPRPPNRGQDGPLSLKELASLRQSSIDGLSQVAGNLPSWQSQEVGYEPHSASSWQQQDGGIHPNEMSYDMRGGGSGTAGVGRSVGGGMAQQQPYGSSSRMPQQQPRPGPPMPLNNWR